MFKQLDREINKKISSVGYFVASAILVVSIFGGSYLWSLVALADSVTLEENNLVLEDLVMPVPIMEDILPIKVEQSSNQVKKARTENISTRREITQRMDESPVTVPEKPSTVSNTGKTRPAGLIKISSVDFDPIGQTNITRTSGSDSDSDTRVVTQNKPVETEEEAAPVMTPKPVSIPRKVNIGVVNSVALYLPSPPYPILAKQVNLVGKVVIAIQIDKNGNVISSRVISGNPLLSPNIAADYAKKAKFKPTLLSGNAVEASGIIIYNFK